MTAPVKTDPTADSMVQQQRLKMMSGFNKKLNTDKIVEWPMFSHKNYMLIFGNWLDCVLEGII